MQMCCISEYSQYQMLLFRSIFLFFLYQQLLQKALNAAFPVMAQHLLFKRNTGDTMEIASERGVAEKKLRVKKLF